MLKDIAINLLAAFLGFLFARAYAYLREVYEERVFRSFWIPTTSSKITLFFGKWTSLLSDAGELEPLVNMQDALTLGELKVFLDHQYSVVVPTVNESDIDWRYPVITLGGPLPNPLTKAIGEQGLLPIWFLDIPYSERSKRAIGTTTRAEIFRPEFDEGGQLMTDVGFVARIRSPQNPQQFLYVIAGCYGIGTRGVVRHLTSGKGLRQLQSMSKDQCFQAIVRCYVIQGSIIDTKVVHYRELD